MSNLADRFVKAAAARAGETALILARGRGAPRETTFGELARWSDGYAWGARRAGLEPGARVLLLVRPGPDLVAQVFGMLKAGLAIVLIDPGMDRRSFLGCVETAAPEAMIGVPVAHLLAARWPRTFSSVRRRWLAGWPWAPGASERMRHGAIEPFASTPVSPEATAAVVFTTGSTGVPKGVIYSHGNYGAQLDLLARRFAIDAGQVTLAGYLPFALLCLCMGATCVLPRVNPARPASVDAGPVLDLMKRYRPSLGLGSPAFWGRLAEHCATSGARLDSLRQVLLFGAEVHEPILRGLRAALPDEAVVQTPYGSTEAQPISTISDRELLDPALLERRAALGVCVGTPIDGVEVRLVPVTDRPLSEVTAAPGAVGEVAVRGPMVTAGYLHQPEQDRLHKIGAPPGAWHRMGDCGSIDEDGRLWLAGRRSQRVETPAGTLFPLPVEARVNRHPAVRRSALVGPGARGAQRPVVVIELIDSTATQATREAVVSQIMNLLADDQATRVIQDVLVHPRLPVDYRHNAKIQREAVAVWAAEAMRGRATMAAE
ncbi:MAG: AMP-binding protein [Acidobacteria bacterium]|nr:AMP-binding protein [Acidobacteriota bacterium]